MMLMILAAAAALGGADTSHAVHDALAAKFKEGAILDLYGLHADATSPTLTCGQLVVDRQSERVKFVIDTKTGVAWLEQTPAENNNETDNLRRPLVGLTIGDVPEFQHAWRVCASKGTALPSS